jgi:hypothetical protein
VNFRFRFDLDEVVDIEPWGSDAGPKSLSWFGLTSGRYWIETPYGDVLRYSAEIRKLWNFPFNHVDYQVARLFEDLQDCLPAMLEPVPDDIARLATNPEWSIQVTRWVEQEVSDDEGRARWELKEAAMSWLWQREIDTAYLSYGPHLTCWRTGGGMHFRWTTEVNHDRNTQVFVAPNGEIALDVATFEAAAFGFCEDVLSRMRDRVGVIHRNGWSRLDCVVDVGGLVREQRHREDRFRQLLAKQAKEEETNWPEVRAHLQTLKAAVGSD